jgi:hypothetical protein
MEVSLRQSKSALDARLGDLATCANGKKNVEHCHRENLYPRKRKAQCW